MPKLMTSAENQELYLQMFSIDGTECTKSQQTDFLLVKPASGLMTVVMIRLIIIHNGHSPTKRCVYMQRNYDLFNQYKYLVQDDKYNYHEIPVGASRRGMMCACVSVI